jgi:hypothetical protein
VSIVCLSHVMRHSEATLGARLVLFVLAEHAHDDGTEAYPSVETIGERTRLSRKGVQGALRRLEADRMIVRDGEGPRRTTKWRVVMGGEETTPANLRASGGEVDDLEGGEAATPEPSLGEPSEESSDTAREDTPSSMTYRGRKVPRPVVDVAARSVRYFASKTGQTLRVVDGTGRASTSLQRVVGAMLAHPELADPDFARRTIDFALAAPWWRDEGPPGVGVVFGPNVVERMVEQARRDEPPAPRGPSNGRPSASDLLRMLDE